MPRQQASLTVEAHRALVSAAAYASGITERRVTMSEILVAAITVARAHPDELGAALTAPEGTDS